MLSKSQARTFFISGTLACAVAFVGLTLDTFRRIPAQTRAAAITPDVARGKELWDHNNCMGCHSLFGEGAYYAPELTKVYERRGESFIRGMLTDPEAMFKGQRKMQKYAFSEPDKAALVAFFRWTGQVDLNGFPAKPPLARQATPSRRDVPQPQIFGQLCIVCHSLAGQGGNVGPALDGVGNRRDAEYLRRWLRDPPAVKPDTRMPKLGLPDSQIDELVAFLEAQR
jgi:nitric oxide reductase subunit C